MFKLVVLSALVAVAVAKPGYLHGAVGVAAPVVAQTYVSPAAVSSTYREDVIREPAVAYVNAPVAVAAPVVAKTIVAEPVAVAAPVVTKTVVAPAAVSHTYRADIVSKPAVVAYAAPAVVSAPVIQKAIVSAPVAYSAHVPAAYSFAAHAPVIQAW